MAPRPTIHPTRHKDAKVFQGRRISGLHPRYTTGTDRGNEGLFNESVGIVMSSPKRHHYLPRFYLENFCNDGQLWVFDRKNKQYRNQTPNNTALQTHYYSVEDKKGNKNTDIELFLSRIEGQAQPIISKINASEQISNKEKDILSIFIALLMNRVPDFEKSVNEVNEYLIKQMSNLMFSDEKTTQSILSQDERDTGKKPTVTAKDTVEFHKNCTHRNLSLGMMLELSMDLAKYFRQMDWLFLNTPDKKSFVTTDNPVVLVSPGHKQESFLGDSIVTTGVTKLVPLSQRTCLIMLDRGELVGYRHATIESVRKINIILAQNTDQFLIGRDEALVRNLVKTTRLDQYERKSRFRII